MSFFLDLKHIGRKDKRSLTEMILPEDYQKGLPSENKKKAASAMNVIFKNPADCIFIIGEFGSYVFRYFLFIDSLEDLPFNSKVIEALVTGESETEISTGKPTLKKFIFELLFDFFFSIFLRIFIELDFQWI